MMLMIRKGTGKLVEMTMCTMCTWAGLHTNAFKSLPIINVVFGPFGVKLVFFFRKVRFLLINVSLRR